MHKRMRNYHRTVPFYTGLKLKISYFLFAFLSISSKNQPKLDSGRELRIRRRKYMTLRLTFILVGAYILCWLPYNVLDIWWAIDEASYAKFENYFYWMYSLI